jgi:hypothetical protein
MGNDDKHLAIGAVFAAILFTSVFYFVGVEYSDCKDQGGDLVRGIFWLKCI